MRELRNGKSYETKWYIVNEIGFGDVAAVDTLLPRTPFKSISVIELCDWLTLSDSIFD